MNFKLKILTPAFAIARLAPDATVPNWATKRSFYSIHRTDDELSIVCDETDVPHGVKAERGWRAIKVEAKIDFALTGLLYSLTKPLAEANVSVFALSTFDTDYLLVKEKDLLTAQSALNSAGFTFTK